MVKFANNCIEMNNIDKYIESIYIALIMGHKSGNDTDGVSVALFQQSRKAGRKSEGSVFAREMENGLEGGMEDRLSVLIERAS